jgi:4-methylaminobutanoate oxidase (formaldehyde-forming)
VLRRAEGLGRRLLQFRLADPEPLLHHNEPIWREGRTVGRITSAAYGHHLGSAIGLGYVTRGPEQSVAEVAAHSYEIEIAGERFAAAASHRPLYDPDGLRIRA